MEYEIKKQKRVSQPPVLGRYLHIFRLNPVGETGEGETVVYPNTKENYYKLMSGLIPRLNKKFPDMKWLCVVSDDKKELLIQRVK